jgi:hypothetical protein
VFAGLLYDISGSSAEPVTWAEQLLPAATQARHRLLLALHQGRGVLRVQRSAAAPTHVLGTAVSAPADRDGQDPLYAGLGRHIGQLPEFELQHDPLRSLAVMGLRAARRSTRPSVRRFPVDPPAGANDSPPDEQAALKVRFLWPWNERRDAPIQSAK